MNIIFLFMMICRIVIEELIINVKYIPEGLKIL
jgi:hypothetical protein